MSRVGKNPVPVPGNVEVTLSSSEVSVKAPLGTLKRRLVSDISVEHEGGKLIVKAANDSKQANAMSGTMRALLANMVKGVTNGFEKKLTLVGVGYRAQAAGDRKNRTGQPSRIAHLQGQQSASQCDEWSWSGHCLDLQGSHD